MAKIKVCGLTRYEDAALAAELGAWGLGFIFTDKSPRACDLEMARDIIRRLNAEHARVEKVGVFLNESAHNINAVAENVGITIAQMHGSESPEECSKVNIPVLKAIQELDVGNAEVLNRYRPHMFLMDAPRVGEKYGGTGQKADWEQARQIAKEYPLFLAGSLNAENIVDALEKVQPMGADLSSSLEASHGIKDPQKIRDLFKALENAGIVPG